MFSGPMFRREYQAATRRRRPFVLRTVVAVVLCVVTALVGLVVFTGDPGGTSGLDLNRPLVFGRAAFLVSIGVVLLFLLFLVPAFTGGAIAEEREKGTLPLVLLTRLTPIEIVVTKAVARGLSMINLVLVGVPVVAATAWVAGLDTELVLALLVLLSSAGFMTALTILASARHEQVGTARAEAMAWISGWLLGAPFLTLLPIRSGTLWGDLLAALKAIAALVAPSSPLSLATDRAWYYRPQAVSLEGRVAAMIGLQALFGLLALGVAAIQLKPREANPNWWDPARGHRPPCGDDPIYWREYELPMRRGAGSLIVLRLRYVLILLRAILISVLTLVMTLLALAIPIGLLVATVHLGWSAFQELRQYGYGPGGPFVERAKFNLLIRAATGLLVYFPSLGLTSTAFERIKAEKNKKTWDALLMTPLSGEEILRSKARVAVHGIGRTAWPLPILWALGLACGVVLPLGVALAALDLVLAFWASLALGLNLGIRPVATDAASSRSALSLLAVFVLHTPLLWAALASPRELAHFASWDVRLRWGLVLAALAVPILTGTAAWVWSRQTLRRFDEWVGRPCSAGRA